ncbi:MAG TPA: alpha/beta hydrolase [Candidatus Methylomirabilis sp.]|nr:alpha/beta hydrolase [Candidatus Methylomirabilis sp.]
MGSVVIAERTIHYHAAESRAARPGRNVLYVHGTGCNGQVWLPHMQAIADRHRPVAIDLPGHGESTGRGFRGVADYAYFAVELTRALRWDRFVIAGHSLGGAIALLTALHHGDLLDGLILVDTGARLRVDPTLLRGARQAAEAGRAPAADRSWTFASATPQSVVDAVQKLTAGTDPAVTYQDWIADDTFDVMSRVKEIRVPTLAICGAQDRLTPVKYHQFLAAQIPGCQLEIVENAGHWMFWEHPEVFTRTVRSFLDGLPERR